jgi:TolA-binding protein
MSSPELHPDDLLDKEDRGALSSDEHSRLVDHLALCSVCRFERQVRSDFRGEFESAARRAKMATAPVALAPTVKTVAPTLTEQRAAIPRRRMLTRPRFFALLAAALLTATAAAAEFTSFGLGGIEIGTSPSSSDLGDVREAPSALGSSRRPGTTSAFDAAISSAVPPVVEATLPSPSSDPSARAARIVAMSSRNVAALVPSPLAPPPAASAPEPLTPPRDAATLFAEAGDARRRGSYDDALRLYGDLSREHPSSAEGLAAHAILGRLLLDRGNYPGALAHFDTYLKSGVPFLREESLLGRAVSLQHMGNAPSESAAWSALLAEFPRSVHAARARTRLSELSAR